MSHAPCIYLTNKSVYVNAKIVLTSIFFLIQLFFSIMTVRIHGGLHCRCQFSGIISLSSFVNHLKGRIVQQVRHVSSMILKLMTFVKKLHDDDFPRDIKTAWLSSKNQNNVFTYNNRSFLLLIGSISWVFFKITLWIIPKFRPTLKAKC